MMSSCRLDSLLMSAIYRYAIYNLKARDLSRSSSLKVQPPNMDNNTHNGVFSYNASSKSLIGAISVDIVQYPQ